jgi:Protein of unknown function (DUF1176)
VFSLLLIAAAAAPAPAEIRTFQDWTVACDNGAACRAVALTPKGSEGPALTMVVDREAGAAAQPWIRFGWGDEDLAVPTGLRADGRRISAQFIASATAVGLASVRPALREALRAARKLELLGRKGRPVGVVSLAGASDALRWMDERQGRLDTVTALIGRGPKPAGAVLSPPPLPVVEAPALGQQPPRSLDAAVMVEARKRACEGLAARDDEPAETYRLDAGHSLAYVPLGCRSNGYNAAALLLVAGETGDWAAAALDDVHGAFDPAIAYNVSWDAAAGRLLSDMKGRERGDCGISRAYVWDGSRFRLVRQSEMRECRGAFDYITTWRADVRRR